MQSLLKLSELFAENVTTVEYKGHQDLPVICLLIVFLIAAAWLNKKLAAVQRRREETRPVENHEIFDHLFITKK